MRKREGEKDFTSKIYYIKIYLFSIHYFNIFIVMLLYFQYVIFSIIIVTESESDLFSASLGFAEFPIRPNGIVSGGNRVFIIGSICISKVHQLEHMYKDQQE